MIELLTVIAVIAVLAAILMTVLPEVQRKARQANCVSNLRQIGTAMHVYVNENGRFPYRSAGLGSPHIMTGSGYDLNESFIYPYIENRNEVMFCPGLPLQLARSAYAQSGAQPGSYADRHVTYQYYIFSGSGGQGGIPHDVDPIRLDSAVGGVRVPFWGCLTVAKSDGTYLAHDSEETEDVPRGQSVVYSDASVKWVDWNDLEPIIDRPAQSFWWPEPDEHLRRALRELRGLPTGRPPRS